MPTLLTLIPLLLAGMAGKPPDFLANISGGGVWAASS